MLIAPEYGASIEDDLTSKSLDASAYALSGIHRHDVLALIPMAMRDS